MVALDLRIGHLGTGENSSRTGACEKENNKSIFQDSVV